LVPEKFKKMTAESGGFRSGKSFPKKTGIVAWPTFHGKSGTVLCSILSYRYDIPTVSSGLPVRSFAIKGPNQFQ
jgi:hypothetical protein